MINIDGKIFEVKEVKSRENTQNPEVAKFVARTKNRIHNPDLYNKLHNELKEVLFKNFNDVEVISDREYKIPSLNNLIVEDRLDRYHNYNLYRPGNGIQQVLLNKLIEENEVEFIKQWCIVDFEKSKKMDEQGINFLEIYSFYNEQDILKQIDRKVNGIHIIYNNKEMKSELKNLYNKRGDFSAGCTYNKCTSTFNGHFYQQEKNLYNKSYHRRWIIENLMKYLVRDYEWAGKEVGKNRKGIDCGEILRQFRISRICDGFSQHSPLWIKAFIEKYNIKSIYDFTGGWGHRMIGSWKIDYIYNDIDERTMSGVKRIYETFKDEPELKTSGKKSFYCNDSSKFTPEEDYECVFSCPPYFTTEMYQHEKTSTSTHSDYDNWLNGWWYNTIKCSLKPSVKYFAFIISNKYREDMKKVCLKEEFGLEFIEEINVDKGTALNHFHRNPSKEEGGKSDQRIKNIQKGEKIVVFRKI
jgi:hypothetical protein